MKKVLLMFAFIATLLVGSIGTAGAQVNYTVYDGTNTSSYIPLYGLYCDEYFKCEYVIPADHLDAINGSTISKLTYYLGTSATASWGNANFQVFVKEVASSSISSFSGTDDATIVYQGSLDGTGSTMEINFATPYTYNGGNLLVGIYNTVKGSFKGAYFLGQTISNAAVYGHNSSSLASVTSATAVNFIPKTTFTVDELHGCLTPTNLAVSDVTTYGATVTWTPGNTETAWVVKFNDDEYPVGGTPSYTVTGLTPNTSYVASVKAVCGGSEESEYTTPGVSFTTLPTCPAPTAVTVSNVTAHSAEISWTSQGNENAWEIEYNGTTEVITTNPYSLTGLDAATSYTVKVKANCSDDDESDWSTEVSFATPCEAVVVTETSPFTEDFNTLTSGIPNCWDNAEGTTTTDSYKWNYYSAGNTGAGVRFNSYTNSTGQTNYLKTAELDLSALTTVAVNFSYKNPTGGDFSVYYTIDGTNYVEIASGLTGVSAWTNAEYIVNDLAGATNARIIFKGTSNWGSGDAYIYLDDIMVAKVPTCPKPTAVTVSNITETTADIAWTNGGTETAWTIDYNGTEIAADSNPFTLTNLTNSTLYTVKVKAICSDDDESDWSTEVSFRTECGTVVVTDENPFLEGFEGPDFGCWTTEQVAGTANWELSTSYASEGNKSAKFPWTTNAEGRLISPILDLTQLTNSFVKFGHNQPVFSGAADELHLYYRASASDDWTLLQSFTTPTTGFAEEEIALPNPSATYQICFHGKGLDKLAIYVDNVFVGAYIPCLTPTAVVVSNETETSADVDWAAGNQETAWNIRYRPVSNSVFFDFEDGMQGWTTLNTDGDEYVFVHSSENIGEYDYTSFGHNGSNGFAVSNSYIDYVGEVNANQYLVAPNAITVDSVTSLNFYYDFGNDTYPDYFEAGIFTQDPTDTTNFTSLWNSQDRGAANTNRSTVRHTEPTRYNNWREVTIDLSEYAGQQVWIAFHHQDYDNYELWLDDITIGELPDEWTVVEGVTNPYTIEGLTANTTYEVQVQAACSEDETSDWTASVEFTTLGETPVVDTCAVPTNVIVENNVATWESEAENFNLTYVVGENATTVEVAGNTYTFEGLEDSTTVSVMVQAICDEDNVSEWSEAVEFVFSTVGINNYSIKANVYPNPAHNVVNVECANIGANLSVYDMFGKVVMNTTTQSERTELNFSNVAPGVYMIRIADNNAMTTVKVIKK